MNCLEYDTFLLKSSSWMHSSQLRSRLCYFKQFRKPRLNLDWAWRMRIRSDIGFDSIRKISIIIISNNQSSYHQKQTDSMRSQISQIFKGYIVQALSIRYDLMIDRHISVNGKQYSISQDLSLSHAGTVWDGALTLISYWDKNKQIGNKFIKGKRVLQLGSGTGAVGICATAFQPSVMYLTDLEQYIKILEVNMSKNNDTANGSLRVSKLAWGCQQDINLISDIDTIIGSQLAYDKQNVIRLMQTIKYYKKQNPALKVVISYQKYVENWKNLHIKFQEYFHGEYRLVEWQDFDEDYRDQHIGVIYID